MSEKEKAVNVEIENESLKEFFAKVTADEAVMAKLMACKDLDEAYAFASSIQDGFTKEEFEEFTRQMKDAAGTVELTDDDLNALAGGLSDGATTSISTGVAAAISTALAFAMW